MKDIELENHITGLHARGWSIRRLSLEFSVSRRRIRRILKEKALERTQGVSVIVPPKKRGSKLDAYKETIAALLATYKNPPPTNQRILELIREKGYTGGITILADYLQKIRGKAHREVIRCVETAPGQLANHDWSEYSIRFTDTPDKIEKVIFFSYILSYSRRQYIEVVDDKTRPTLLRCLVNAFIYLDGAPHQIKSDNQKACVDRWELGKPVFNKEFLSFATHYRFRPLTIQPGKPSQNLKVERAFYYLETNFLNARSFKNRQDLKQQLLRWLKEKNDTRIHRTTGRAPIEMYREEVPYLQPLPKTHYDTSLILYRVVSHESCVTYLDHHYYVPGNYLYESCPVRITDQKIIIYSPDCTKITEYDLASKNSGNRYTGLPPKAARKPQIAASELLPRLEAFGPDMKQFIIQIKKDKPNNYLYHLRIILSLKVNYYPDDILLAVRRALKFKVFHARAIENFLCVNAQAKHTEKLTP